MSSNIWRGFVRALHLAKVRPYGHLKTAILGQAILESGRGTSEVSNKCLNFHGMKWREEMRLFAIPQWVETASEPSGGAYFCCFASADNAVKGYWGFLDRKPYKGWKDHAATAEQFLAFIGPIWCPGGYTDAWKASHGGLTYDRYIMEKLYMEAETLLKEESESEIVVRKAFWADWFREPGAIYIMESGTDTAVGRVQVKSYGIDDLIRTLRELKKTCKVERVLFAPDGKAEPSLTPLSTPATPIGRKILVDPGHSEKKPGARGISSSVQEEDLNRLQAEVIKQLLEFQGYEVWVYDPQGDDLVEIGSRARDFDMFISLHHNAYDRDRVDEYTCCMVHQLYAKLQSREFATLVATKVADAINNPIYHGGDLPGVYPARLAVLNAAEHSGCPGPCVLVESYFVDAYDDVRLTEGRSKKAATAIAGAVTEWFSKMT